MYEYKATVVGPLSSLRREKKVEDVGVSLADAYTAALNHYGSQGWKLHSVVPISSPIILLVFEKYVLDPEPRGIHDGGVGGLGPASFKRPILDPDYSDTATYKDDVPITYTNPHDYQYRGRCPCHNPHDAENEGGT